MDNQVKSAVRLKGVGDGLQVTIDPGMSVDFIQEELTRLFKRMGHLAINSRVTLDLGGQGYEELIADLGTFLKENFNVGTVSGPDEKRSVSEERIRQRDLTRSWHSYRSDVLMLTGRVRSGQQVSARKHLLILGDVNPGAEVISGGDLIVLGSLCGAAYAGQPDNSDAIIFALDFRPTQIQIGRNVAAGSPMNANKIPEFAHIDNGAIVVEEYLKSNPFSRMPWPKVR